MVKELIKTKDCETREAKVKIIQKKKPVIISRLVEKLYPLELIGNKRGSRPGDEDVNLDNICCSLRGSAPDDEEGNETKDLHDNDTHGPRPPKVRFLPGCGDSEPFIVNETANGRRTKSGQ